MNAGSESAKTDDVGNIDEFAWIVLDVTGTLLVPDPEPVEIYHQAAKEYGVHIPKDALSERLGAAIRWNFSRGCTESCPLRREASSELIERERWRSIVGECLQELAKTQHTEVYERLWRHFSLPQHWRWRQGVEAIVTNWQRQGRQLAIATNFDRRVHRILDGFPGLRPIEDRFLSSEVGFSKPDRRFFDFVAQRLSPRGESLLMIGDDVTNDLEGSRAAGWRAMHIRDLLGS